MFKPNLSKEDSALLHEAYLNARKGNQLRAKMLMEAFITQTPKDHLEMCNTKNPRMLQ